MTKPKNRSKFIYSNNFSNNNNNNFNTTLIQLFLKSILSDDTNTMDILLNFFINTAPITLTSISNNKSTSTASLTPLTGLEQIDDFLVNNNKFALTAIKNKNYLKQIFLNKNKDNLLHYSCRLGKLNMIRKILSKNYFNLNEKNFDGDSALTLVCDRGYHECARILLEYNDTNLNNNNSNTPSTSSACNIGLNLNIENNKFKTPLILASELLSPYDLDMCKLLVQHGANISYQTKNFNNILLSASKFGNYELIRYIIESDRNIINLKFNDGASALMRACYYNYIDIVNYLIENRANIEDKNNRHETPLYIASYRGHYDIAKLLINYGANVNCEDIDGDTPLTVACYEYKTDIIYLLLAHNSNVNKQGIRGDGPIHIAVSNCDINIVNNLIACNVNVDLLNNDNETALHIACKQNRHDMIKILINYSKLSFNKISRLKYTPLKYIIESIDPDRIDIAVKLIQAGSDVNLIKFKSIQTNNVTNNGDTNANGDNNDARQLQQGSQLNAFNEQISCLEHLFKNYETKFKEQNEQKLLIDFIDVMLNSGYKVNTNEINIIKTVNLFSNVFNNRRLKLLERLKTPNSLASICRVHIRNSLRKPLHDSIQTLVIPTLLKEFLYLI